MSFGSALGTRVHAAGTDAFLRRLVDFPDVLVRPRCDLCVFLPDGSRRLLTRGGLFSPSLDGGLPLFELFNPRRRSSSATCAFSAAISALCATISAISSSPRWFRSRIGIHRVVFAPVALSGTCRRIVRIIEIADEARQHAVFVDMTSR
jgi:hypothetical protein